MTLRNGTISKDYPQDPHRCLPRKIPSSTGTEAGAFYCKVTAIFLSCSLMMPGALISPVEQESPTTALTYKKIFPVKSPSFSGFPNIFLLKTTK